MKAKLQWRGVLSWGLLLGLVLCALSPLLAQPPSETPGADPAQEVGEEPSDELPREQDRVADRYQQLENLIFKMADYEAASNPRRAALLKQAYKQSKDRLTLSQLNKIAELLQDQKYKSAIDGQKTARQNLGDLLRLLMSEDRSDRLKSEQQRIKEYIKELKRIERIQRGVRGRTEAARDPRRLTGDQEKAADRTGDLAEQIEQDDARSQSGSQGAKGQEGEGQSGASDQKQDDESQDQHESDEKDPSDRDQPDPEKKPGKEEGDEKPEDQSAGGEENGGEGGESPEGKQNGQSGQPGDASQDQDGQPSDQQDSQGQSQSGQSSEGQGGGDQQQSQPQNPAQQRVRDAEQKMREAQRELEEAKRSESVEKQTEALQNLEEAIAELEEILRQLREEEMERMLALLEGRFRKMLEMELEVYEGTVRISEIEQDQRDRTADVRAGKLAFSQRKIVAEADRTLTLLLDEGSSIAFPEIVELMRDDMEEVAARLDQIKVDQITQGLEEDIIATLEELIEALQKAQQDMEEGNQPPMGQPGQAGPPPLVDILAELKMIRSLQIRVNTRTERYSRLLDNPDDPVGQAIEQDLRRAISELSDQESRIQRITRDIALEKNK
ncbi:MAG: hypothetical protein ACQESR_18215 [Planctomycetota bacterium]